MTVRQLVDGYARALTFGGPILVVGAALLDPSWLANPLPTLLLLVGVVALRGGQVSLTKYAYLTQIGVPALVGAVTLGPGAVAISLWGGVLLADLLWVRKSTLASFINAGREATAFVSAFGIYVMVLRLTGAQSLSLDYLPAAFTLLAAYFFTSRSMFYFTLLFREKLESDERLVILRYELLTYLLTVTASVILVASVRGLSPLGWLTVVLVLGVIGLLTKRILEDAIGAEELNKVHVREKVIAGNLSLQDSFAEMERLAHRLLDWGDMRVFRMQPDGPALVYRGVYGRDNRDETIPEMLELRNTVLLGGEPLIIPDATKDPRVSSSTPQARSILIAPLTFGEEVIGTLELEHHKRHAYRQRDLEAVATFANQLATAIHISDLRRPLVSTVEKIGGQVRAFGENIDILRRTTTAVATASATIRAAMGSQGRAMEDGLAATATLAHAAGAMAAEGARAAESAAAASEVARQSRETILDAVARLVQLKNFVTGSSRQVEELGRVSERITGFIGSIREIADLTNLIALNAAIEAARAGRQGQGFAVVADEVRQLAAQSAEASREAGVLVASIAGKVEDITRQMARGEQIVEGVEDVSAGAADALSAIVRATDSAGTYGRQIAETAAEQEVAFSRLRKQIEDLTTVSTSMLAEAEDMAARASEATAGHAEMERSVRELEAVASNLHAIARSFTPDVRA